MIIFMDLDYKENLSTIHNDYLENFANLVTKLYLQIYM